MITYQEIYDILRKEKYNEELQQLPQNFLEEVSSYLLEKKDIVNREQKNQELFSDTMRIIRKQLDNALSIIKEILVIRERKVLNLAFIASITGITKKDTENLLEHEKELFEVTIKKLEQNQHNISKKLNGNLEKKKDLKNVLIRFTEEVPAFLNIDGTELGPFKQGDVANLRQEIAEILLSDRKAVAIEET